MRWKDALMVLWAVGGITLAVLFFLAVHREGLRSGSLGARSGLLLLACVVWNVLLRVLLGVSARYGSK
ncbi:MAG: hypothetical protein JO250_06145 [Armatimonadetes bacterium]|nr:hypothetical protein [Armatimonadota bacterium]